MSDLAEPVVPGQAFHTHFQQQQVCSQLTQPHPGQVSSAGRQCQPCTPVGVTGREQHLAFNPHISCALGRSLQPSLFRSGTIYSWARMAACTDSATEEKACLGTKASSCPPDSLLRRTPNSPAKALTLESTHPADLALSLARMGTELPWEEAEPRAAIVSCQKQVFFKQCWINEWTGRQLQGKVSATIAMRFVRAYRGQQVLVMGNWEQVTAQHYKGNLLQEHITSHTNFLICSSISDTSKNSLTLISNLGSTKRPIHIAHLCQQFSRINLSQPDDGHESQLQHSNAFLIKSRWVLSEFSLSRWN